MFGIGPFELVVIFAIILLLFGGKRLPGIASGLGTAIRNFKTALKDGETTPNHQLNATQSATKTDNTLSQEKVP